MKDKKPTVMLVFIKRCSDLYLKTKQFFSSTGKNDLFSKCKIFQQH